MKIDKNKVVTLVYKLQENDEQGAVVEQVQEEKPFVFLYGSGHMLPKFEENLEGLNEEDSFNFKIEKDEAYGDFQDNAVVDVPKKIFEVDGELREDLLQNGQVIPMEDKEGNQLTGIVKEVQDEKVHLLAVLADLLQRHHVADDVPRLREEDPLMAIGRVV